MAKRVVEVTVDENWLKGITEDGGKLIESLQEQVQSLSRKLERMKKSRDEWREKARNSQEKYDKLRELCESVIEASKQLAAFEGWGRLEDYWGL